MMNYVKPLLPFLAGWALLLVSHTFSTISLVNGLAQLVLFAFVVCLPTWKTGRMSYVDIGWPLGLVVIGLLTWSMSEGNPVRVLGVSAVYLFVGLRMGLGALHMWRKGLLKTEFPRYQYQKLRWARENKTNTPLAMQVEAVVQGVANASFLAMPALVIGANPSPDISVLEMVGLLLWLGAYIIESVSDLQKQAFLKEMKRQGKKNQVCNVGLWRYSRHPNYFAEWMVWNGLVIAAIPSWLALQGSEHWLVWGLVGCGLLFASRIMYFTLVYYTGAVPAEYFSVKKRPQYVQYQQETNRFFPGPVKKTG